MTGKRCHICGKEVTENYYLDKRGYTCYLCSKAIANKRKYDQQYIKDNYPAFKSYTYTCFGSFLKTSLLLLTSLILL